MIVTAGASGDGKARASGLTDRLGAGARYDPRPLAVAVPEAWRDETVDSLVLVCATGIAVRLVGPLLTDKHSDPGVVVLDDAGRHAIALIGGHEGGANLLADHLAAIAGAEPVIGTASELRRDRVIGLGASSDATRADILAVLPQPWTACCIATLDRKLQQPSVVEAADRVGLPLAGFTAAELAAVDVPHPSETVSAAVGTPSVAEAAALLASGAAQLELPKQVHPRVTVAVAVRQAESGSVTVVGLGPGDPLLVPPAARRALYEADDLVGFTAYVRQARNFTAAGTAEHPSPIGAETERARLAIRLAASGRKVALVSSGDAGVYAMAAPLLEIAPADVPVSVVPGITAASAAAAALGAPLGHDHCSISLSDLLTPWEQIERRVRAAAEGDFVVCFYNPRSARRTWQLPKALGILAGHRPPSTPVAVVTDVTRPGERIVRTPLAEVDCDAVTMTSLVVVGSSRTADVNGRIVTPRGYR